MASSSPQTLGQVLASGVRSYSFEFFPPKTDDGERLLWQTVTELEPLQPTFVSVTYGAGGSTRDRTIRVTERIATETTLRPVGHLTCVGASRAEVAAVVEEYAAAGVTDILALRGDPPTGPGTEWVQHPDGLNHAEDLVRLIAERDGFSMPILPGLMPVTNVAQIERFAALSGAVFPEHLADRFADVADDAEAVRTIGVEVATELASDLLEVGAPGLHFFTLNRSSSTREIYQALGLEQR